MKIYNYLFYKSYQLATRSRNFDDMPVLGALGFVSLCIMFNIFTISFLLEGFGIGTIIFEKQFKYPFSILLVLLVLWYYLYHERYKKINEKYRKSEVKNKMGFPPVIIIAAYYIVSFGLMLLSAIFKNGDWIFAK